MLITVAYIIAGLIVGFFFGWFIQHSRFTSRLEQVRIENAELKKDF